MFTAPVQSDPRVYVPDNVSGTPSDRFVLAVSDNTTFPAPSKVADPSLWYVAVNIPAELKLRPVRIRERTPVRVETVQDVVVDSVRPLPVNIRSGLVPLIRKFAPFEV